MERRPTLEESGRVSSVEGTWTMFPRRLMDNKDDRDKHPQRDQAVNRKALWTRVKFHAGSNSVEIRHVNSGILPCV